MTCWNLSAFCLSACSAGLRSPSHKLLAACFRPELGIVDEENDERKPLVLEAVTWHQHIASLEWW
eukprot:2231150-Amphidinium_carterae.1